MQEQEIHLCTYCNQPATYQFKNGKWCCSKNQSQCPAKKQNTKNKLKERWKEVKTAGYTQLKNPTNNSKENIIPNICAYCGGYAEFQLKSGKWCCEPVNQRCPAIKEKNRKAIQKLYDEGKLNQQEIQKNRTKESFERQGWSSGKTKFTDNKLKERGEQLHQKYVNGEIIPSRLGDHHSDEDKDKIV